jgi:hypothetical protein
VAEFVQIFQLLWPGRFETIWQQWLTPELDWEHTPRPRLGQKKRRYETIINKNAKINL